jgi:hypothetical protein
MFKSFSFVAISSLLFYGVFALAQVVEPAPAAELPPADFLSQIFDAVKTLGGLPWAGKVIILCNLLVASMRVTLLRTLLWDKIGWAKFLVAPGLALLGGLVGHFTSGVAISWQNGLAYFMAGAGAILLHEMLDGLKKMPKLGPFLLGILSFIDGLLVKAKIAAPPKK